MIEKKHVVQCRISVVYLEHSIKVCQSWALVVRQSPYENHCVYLFIYSVAFRIPATKFD